MSEAFTEQKFVDCKFDAVGKRRRQKKQAPNGSENLQEQQAAQQASGWRKWKADYEAALSGIVDE